MFSSTISTSKPNIKIDSVETTSGQEVTVNLTLDKKITNQNNETLSAYLRQTANVFMEDYDLKYIFKGNSLIANYPRNYIFYDKGQSAEMKKKLGYNGKRLFAYMPTWRGTGRTADTAHQLEVTSEILNEIDDKLDDNTVFRLCKAFKTMNINLRIAVFFKYIDHFLCYCRQIIVIQIFFIKIVQP